jgi:hypothetical protein
MRPLLVSVLAIAASGCSGILGIPSEGEVGCPEPCRVTVSGKTVRAESPGTPQQPLPQVSITLTSVDPPVTVMSGNDGSYTFPDLPPDTLLEFRLTVSQPAPVSQNQLDTRYIAGKTGTSDIVLDLPVVQFRWLAQVSVDCGIFATLNEALYEPPGMTTVNPYFVRRSTIIGQVLKEDGTAAPLDRADISVLIGSFTNFNQNPADTDAFPATICFLAPNTATGQFKGVNDPVSNTGRFVLFRARNDLGTGAGMGQVRIPGFPAGELNVASGTIGFSRIRTGDGENLPDRLRTFERDIYHFFTDANYRCAQLCHFPPDGLGFMNAPTRFGSDGTPYRADWSASAQEVYDNLTKPVDTNCMLGGVNAARVCKAKPDESLLYRKPGGLAMHGGIEPGTDDLFVQTILKWITDGALQR